MVGFEQLLLSSIGGASVTILVNYIIKKVESEKTVRKQTKILLTFIDEIVIRYLQIHIEDYDSLLKQIKDKVFLFDGRTNIYTPMLNKEIFDFFQRAELIQVFDKSEKYPLVAFYHMCYEIGYSKENTVSPLFDNFQKSVYENFEIEFKINPALTIRNYVKISPWYKKKEDAFGKNLEFQRAHASRILENFKGLKLELAESLFLSSDDFDN